MANTPTLTIDMGQKCPRCGKMGAVNGGPCLECVLKALKKGEYDDRLSSVRRKRP